MWGWQAASLYKPFPQLGNQTLLLQGSPENLQQGPRLLLCAAHWDILLELCVLGWAVGRSSISQWKFPCFPLMEMGSDLRSLKPCTGGGAELDDPGRHGSALHWWSERYWKLWWRRRAWEERHRSTVQHTSLWQVSSALCRRLKTYSGKMKPKALHLKELPAWKADSLHWRQARQQY